MRKLLSLISLVVALAALLKVLTAPTIDPPPPSPPASTDRFVDPTAPALDDRVDIVERAAQQPTVDNLATLVSLAREDADPIVRVRAIIAYTDAAGRDALPVLRDLAQHDPDEDVMAAAQASVHRIANEQPVPARTHIELVTPGPFVPGEPVDLVIRCVADADTPKAHLVVHVPKTVELLDGNPLSWHGALASGQVLERHVRIRATAPASLRARFTADFADALDSETAQLRIAVGDGAPTASSQLVRN